MQEDFELLPNDETVGLMLGEYNKVIGRNNLINNGCGGSCGVDKSPKCGCNQVLKMAYAEIYFKEEDMLVALTRLHSLAPPEYRDDIVMIIRSKKANIKKILKCYYLICDETLSYAPRLEHSGHFCRLLSEILCKQKELLYQLTMLEDCCDSIAKVINCELMIGYSLNSMTIRCGKF